MTNKQIAIGVYNGWVNARGAGIAGMSRLAPCPRKAPQVVAILPGRRVLGMKGTTT